MQDWIIDIAVWLFCLWLIVSILNYARHDKISRMFHDTPWYPGKYIIRYLISLIRNGDER